QELITKLRPGLLATAEHDRHLDLVALPKEPLDVAFLGAVVVRVDLRPDLDLLDDRLRLVLARLPGLEGRLVLVLTEVHELGDRRPSRRRDLDEVEVGFLSEPESVGDRYDSDLLARRAYEPNFRYPDTVVDTRFRADVTSNVTSVPGPRGSWPGQFAPRRVSRKPRTACMRGHQNTAHPTPALRAQYGHATLVAMLAIGESPGASGLRRPAPLAGLLPASKAPHSAKRC